MLNLIIAVLMSTLISVLMRLSERHGKGRVSMLMFNYMMCTALAAAFTSFRPAEGMSTTLSLGLVNGALYLGAFMLLQWNVTSNGVILSSTFMKLGVLVPTLLSLIAFGDVLSVPRVAGLALTVTAVLLMNSRSGQKTAVKSLPGLLLLLLVGGMADGMSKVHEQLGNTELNSLFLLITFGSALILCAAVCVFRRSRVSKWDVIDGILIAVPNYFSTRFLLASLNSLPAVIAYPCFSAGVIAVTSLIGAYVFHERLSRRQWGAMLVIAAALVLLNL